MRVVRGFGRVLRSYSLGTEDFVCVRQGSRVLVFLILLIENLPAGHRHHSHLDK